MVTGRWIIFICSCVYIFIFGSQAVARRVLWNRFCLSVFSSVYKFFWNWLISFFWNLAWCKGPIYSCMWWIFLEKTPIRQKMTKNGQEWPENKFFKLFKKIMSLVLSRTVVKQKFLQFIIILQKLHTWEKYGSQVVAKNGSQPFFNHQYFISRLISDFDFWHVDKHEWKEQGLVTGFPKQFSFWQMGYHFGLRNGVS